MSFAEYTPLPQSGSTPGENRARVWTYVFAVVAATATLGLRLGLDPWFGGRTVLIIFVPPILLSAYFGGLGPGLVATLLAALGTGYFVLPPAHHFAFDHPIDFAQ